MAERISINRDALVDIKRKLVLFAEDTEENIKSLDRSITNAELEGWDDSKYDEFYDKYTELSSNINNEIKRVEEELLPFIKKLETSFDDFFERVRRSFWLGHSFSKPSFPSLCFPCAYCLCSQSARCF